MGELVARAVPREHAMFDALMAAATVGDRDWRTNHPNSVVVGVLGVQALVAS